MLSVIGAVELAEQEAMLREGIAKAKALTAEGSRADHSATGCRDHQAQRVGRQVLGNCQQAGDWTGQHVSGAGRAERGR